MKTSIWRGNGTVGDSSQQADALLGRLLNFDLCLIFSWMAYAVGLAVDSRVLSLVLKMVLAIIVLVVAVLALRQFGVAWRLFKCEGRIAALLHIPTIAVAAVLLVLQMFLNVLSKMP